MCTKYIKLEKKNLFFFFSKIIRKGESIFFYVRFGGIDCFNTSPRDFIVYFKPIFSFLTRVR